MSDDGESLVILGTTQEQVAMAIVNATNGKVNYIYSLEDKQTATSDSKPSYSTHGAIMLDSRDITDGKAYLYASFLKDNEQQLLKILQAVPDRTNEFPEIKFHYSFSDIDGASDFLKVKIPQYMFSLKPEDERGSFYVSGTYRGVGSVMKFYKKNAELRWHAQFDALTSVDAIAERHTSIKGHFYGCGKNS